MLTESYGRSFNSSSYFFALFWVQPKKSHITI